MGTAKRLNELQRNLSKEIARYLGGVTTRDVQRLFQRDASEAYGVLTREQGSTPEPLTGVRGLAQRARSVFLGLSYKLTPARRLLFAAAMAFALIGLVRATTQVGSSGASVDFSSAWFLLSVGTLTYLLALELVDRIRVRDELEVARQLQQELLPSASPSLEGYRVAHSYQTANEVGGDYYDFLVLPDGRVALFIGDASGHGMAAGLLMAIANATLKLAVDLDPTPATVAQLLNRVLCRTGDRRAFMTLFYGLLTPSTGDLQYVCAGHPFPLLRRVDGELLELGHGSLPLGITMDLSLDQGSQRIAPGDLLVLYTDGFPEAVSLRGQVFGYDRIAALVSAGGSAAETQARLLGDFRAFTGDEGLRDDACLVVVGRD